MRSGIVLSAMSAYPIPFVAGIGLAISSFFSLTGFYSSYSQYILLGVLIAGGVPLSYKTLRNLAKGKFSVDLIAFFSIVTALIMDQAFAGAIIVLMQSGGEALENYGNARSTRELKKLLERMPKVAHIKHDNSLEDVSAEDVKKGDLLVVKQGELFPVDGTITDGVTQVDESSITGEPVLITKGRGDSVMSGTINVSGSIVLHADRTSNESEYSRIVELVRAAQNDKAPVQRIADRYGIFLIPITLAVAFAGWLITGNAVTVLAVFVVATPCPLILATPIALMGGLSKAAKSGIIVKGGTPLELLGKSDAVFFDKTGTLTYGRPSVDRLVPLGEYSEEYLFRLAGSVESLSTHPIASEITYIAKIRFQSLPLPENFLEEPGRGVSASVEGHNVRIGNSLFCLDAVTENRDEISKIMEDLATRHGAKASSFLMVDGSLAAILLFSDSIRPGVPSMIADLGRMGIRKTVLLTGDGERNAKRLAGEAGISTYEYSLKPEDKTSYVSREKGEYASVVMVGDGINDAPALASASVGIAMGARGSEISAEASDVVIAVDDVLKVREAVSIGKRTLRIAMQSIIMGMALSSAFMIIAALGYIEPAIGAVIQEIIDIMAITNSLRARI